MGTKEQKSNIDQPVVKSSAVVMACGSRHSCEHCTHYYMRSCSYINRMNDDEYEKHEQLVKAAL